jgi:putative tryptophan/tyrosine transport system substrate-binding protein
LLHLLIAGFGPSRHFAAKQRSGRFRREADIDWQAEPAGSVANDPTRTSAENPAVRPGRNITGVATVSGELEAKRLGLLRELVPRATSIGVLVNPTRPGLDTQLAQIQQAARVLGLTVHILKASSERDLDAVFATLVQLRDGALVITADALFTERSNEIAALTKRYSIPTMFQFREFAATGGLISYGPSIGESYRLAGSLAGRILRGEKVAGLPVIQPTKFELVINMKTAKALGRILILRGRHEAAGVYRGCWRRS